MPQRPYDTGKVRIGLAYERPPRRDMNSDEILIQKVLLGQPIRNSRMGFVLYIAALAAIVFLAVTLD